MKLFYYCFGGAHTSVTCASIHLGFLPDDRIPETYEFKGVPQYDKMDHRRIGTPVYMGRDELGWDIYIMGMENAKTVVIPSIKSYLNVNGIRQDRVLFVNALVKLHPITSLGGILSRRLGLVSLGRPMTVWGIRKSYPALLKIVKDVKKNLRMFS